MPRAVIRLGDDTSHGGKVITASARMTIDGIPVALWGDRCSCPIDGHDTCVICEGEPEAIFDGRPVALEGHKTDCGAVLIASQLRRCNLSPLITAEGAVAGEPIGTPTGDYPEFDRRFQLRDVEDGSVHARQRYRVTTSQGVFEGVTDHAGMTQLIATGRHQEEVTVEVLGDENA